jgi:hypothetical protein
MAGEAQRYGVAALADVAESLPERRRRKPTGYRLKQ